MKILNKTDSPTIDDYNELFNLQMETSNKLFTIIMSFKEIERAIGDFPYIGRENTKLIKRKIKETIVLCS